jgi:opacity protein-like surface antigen
MKRVVTVLAVLISMVGAGTAQAEDRTGVFGLNYTVGPSFIAGGDRAQDVGSVQPGVGAGLQLGLMPNLDFQFAYDYIHADLHSQAITFGGQWRFTPDREYSPFAGAGMGFGKPYAGEGWDHFSLKLNGGLERVLTPTVSLAGLLTYHYIQGGDPIGSVHSIEPGARVIFYFGNVRRATL